MFHQGLFCWTEDVEEIGFQWQQHSVACGGRPWLFPVEQFCCRGGWWVGALYPWYLGDDHKSEKGFSPEMFLSRSTTTSGELVTSWWRLLIGGQDGEWAIPIAEPQARSDASFPSDPESRTWPKLAISFAVLCQLVESVSICDPNFAVQSGTKFPVRCSGAGNGDEWVQKHEFKMLLGRAMAPGHSPCLRSESVKAVHSQHTLSPRRDMVRHLHPSVGNLFYFNKLFWLFDQAQPLMWEIAGNISCLGWKILNMGYTLW